MTIDEAVFTMEYYKLHFALTPETVEAFDMAIKALEQEPVLDKIRAEIDSHCSDNRDRNDGLYIAMMIIDKYKAESEDQEQEGGDADGVSD